ncbi:unnamed protein product, partial [Rotaria magnacalcarata]
MKHLLLSKAKVLPQIDTDGVGVDEASGIGIDGAACIGIDEAACIGIDGAARKKSVLKDFDLKIFQKHIVSRK